MTSDLRVVDVDKLSFFELRAQLKACIVRKKQYHNDVLVQTKCIDRLKRKIGDLVKGELTLKNQRMTEKIVRLQNVIRLKGEIIKRYSSKYGAPPPKYEVPEEFVCSADELEAIVQEATAMPQQPQTIPINGPRPSVFDMSAPDPCSAADLDEIEQRAAGMDDYQNGMDVHARKSEMSVDTEEAKMEEPNDPMWEDYIGVPASPKSAWPKKDVLKDFLREHGLQLGGNKKELIERVKDVLEK